jgi:hypothetical protein
MVTIADKIITTIALAVFAKSSCALGLNDIFSDPAIGIYTDKLILPRGYAVADGIWRDNRGKAVAEPEVNFAGRYWVALHSCGAECRYYSMLDLSTGIESRALDMFSTTEPPSKTRDGKSYITSLETRAQSKLLIAQYHVTLNLSGAEECRERVFVLKKFSLIPVTKTKIGCTTMQNISK